MVAAAPLPECAGERGAATPFPVTLSGVEIHRKGRKLLGPLSLTLSARGITAVMGHNGSGKTTFLRLLHGMERLRAGRIDWTSEPGRASATEAGGADGELTAEGDGDVGRDRTGTAMPRDVTALVFQTPVLMRRTVIDNVAYPLRLRGLDVAAARRVAGDWVVRVGLTGKGRLPAEALSGGERQKMALARALVTEPRLLLLDEPTANLDPGATREIEGILTEVRARGVRIVIATHDAGQARRLADDVIFLASGRLAEQRSAPAFFADPLSAEARAFLRGELPR